MPSVIVAGAGLAGLAAAVALADSGFEVDVFESRPFPGGRATSYTIPSADGTAETLDNCQHVLLRCCGSLLDFYRRLGVADRIAFHDTFWFIEPGGAVSELRAGPLPAPAHYSLSFLKVGFLTLSEKLALARGLRAVQREASRPDLAGITMGGWLRAHGQPPRVIERFWRQVLVSAINEELDVMAASHGFQVMLQAFLATRDSAHMGLAAVPLGELYHPGLWKARPNVRFHFRRAVDSLNGVCRLADGEERSADYYVAALPPDRAGAAAGLPAPDLGTSPITGIHLWFDRAITDLPHATLLDRNIQWMFNKGAGRQIQLVVSASRQLLPMSRGEIIEMALRELAEFFPAAGEAQLLRAHVVKEVKATFAASPEAEALRPGTVTDRPNLFLAGDWVRTGWPATMEGAVRSGYLAAEAVTAAAGVPRRFL